jgi:hypothetical protein
MTNCMLYQDMGTQNPYQFFNVITDKHVAKFKNVTYDLSEFIVEVDDILFCYVSVMENDCESLWWL